MRQRREAALLSDPLLTKAVETYAERVGTAAKSCRDTGTESGRDWLAVRDMPLGEENVYLPTPKKPGANSHLNYIPYEISLLAERFGIHAKPVLVAPAVE